MKIQIVTTLDIDLNGEKPEQIMEVFRAMTTQVEYFKHLTINPDAYKAVVTETKLNVTEIPNLLKKPLSNKALRALQDEDGWIDVTLSLDQDDLSKDIDVFNDLVESKIVGPNTRGILSDLNYSFVGIENTDNERGGNVLMRVQTQFVNDDDETEVETENATK